MEARKDGTTDEQWDHYNAALKMHQERVKHEEPKRETYGYMQQGLEEQGGWTIEGGEEAYNKAVWAWRMMSSCDEPNKPGYYRANND